MSQRDVFHPGRDCQRCGMPIEFINGPSGRPLPAQKIRTVYRLLDTEGGRRLQKKEGAAEEMLYVSHFETCPNADEFSRKDHRKGL